MPPAHPPTTRSAHDASRLGFSLPAFVVAAFLLLMHAAWYMPYVADDSLISLTYAVRLATGEGLTWASGEHVEGYSNPLWVLAVSGLIRLGIDALLAARLLGVFSALTAMALLVRLGSERSGAAWIAPCLLATAGPFALWSIAGLEPVLTAALVVWAMVALIRRAEGPAPLWPVVTALGLLVVARAEGPLFTVVSCAVYGVWAVLAKSSRLVRDAGILAGVPFLVWVGVTACRYLYYGDFVPNTAHVKLGVDSNRFDFAVNEYLANAWWAMGGAALVGVIVPFCSSKVRIGPVVASAWLLAALWAGYITIIGGDYMPGYRRHLVGLAPVLVLTAYGAGRLSGRGRAVLAVAAVAGMAQMLAVSVSDASLARARVTGVDSLWWPSRPTSWEWLGMHTGEALRRAFPGQRPTLAVSAAGCLPFATGWPAIDMLGLNDRHIARVEPDGSGVIGHDRADGPYVLSKKPDLIQFGPPPGQLAMAYPFFLQVAAHPDFAAHYRVVQFTTEEGVRSLFWIRRDGVLGVRQGDDGSYDVPAHLFAGASFAEMVGRADAVGGDMKSLARELANRPFRALLRRAGGVMLAGDVPEEGVTTSALTLPAGTWRARAVPDGSGVVALDLVAGGRRGESLHLDVSTSVVAVLVSGGNGLESVRIESGTRESNK